jgi:fumarate reductase flavoprotein subunit
MTVIEESLSFIETPFRTSAGDLTDLRNRLLDKMWDDAGIIRSKEGLECAYSDVEALREELSNTGIGNAGKEYNQTWHDWLNLHSQMSVSLSIIKSALARKNSRGAHYRDDYPDTGDLNSSTYIRVRQDGENIVVTEIPVEFTRVKPGQTLIPEESEDNIGDV